MNKKVLAFLILTIFTISLCTMVCANDYNYIEQETEYKLLIEDDALLLSSGDKEKLTSKMMPLTEYGNIIFKSTNENYTSTEQYAHDIYYNKFGTSSGSLFLIDMDNRIIYIYSDGNNLKIITNSKAEIITDNIYRYASRKDYYTCAVKAFEQMNTLLEGNKIVEPMRYIGNILISAVSAFLIVYIYIYINSNIKSATKDEILKNCKVRFGIRDVSAKKVGEHREYSPQSSGSSSSFLSGGHSSGGGGHSSGHSSHSSHSSGGGGGHRF